MYRADSLSLNNFNAFVSHYLVVMDMLETINIELSGCLWWIDKRPAYCDRGRYLWHCAWKEQSTDAGEVPGFPRYFYNPNNMISEMITWMRVHQQVPIKIIRESFEPTPESEYYDVRN